MSTTKVQNLTDLGTIAPGDKIVGEKVAGTTGIITYAVEIAQDPAPTLGANLSLNGKNVGAATPTEIGYLSGVTSAIQTQFTNLTAAAVLDSDFSTNGTMIRTASGTYTSRTMTGTASRLSVTNGDGVAGNPTFDIDTAYVGQNTITTLGTVTTGTWNGTNVAVGYGGSGRATAVAYAPIVGGTTTTAAHQSMVSAGTSGQILQSGGASAIPAWSTPTYPSSSGTAGKMLRANGTDILYSTATFADTYQLGRLLYASSSDTVSGLASANSGVLVTDGSGIPSIGTNIPTAVTIGSSYIYRASGTDVPVADGGTGLSATTAYAVLCGGTTATGALQSIASVGTSGQVLVSGGTGTLPSFSSTLTNPTITNYTETSATPTVTAGAVTLDLANGTIQKVVTAANTTITLPSASAGKSLTVIVQYGGTHTITWAGGGTLKWAGGTAPTATSSSGKYDLYVFVCHDSSITFGADGGRNA